MQTLVIKCSDDKVVFHFLGDQNYPENRGELGTLAQEVVEKRGKTLAAYGLADSDVLDTWYENNPDNRHLITIDGDGNVSLPVP